MTASVTFGFGFGWIVAGAVIAYVVWVVVMLTGAKTLAPDNTSGYSDAERRQALTRASQSHPPRTKW